MKRFLSHKQKHLLGIFGGVGPLAHVEFEKMLLASNYARGARKDQDHPVWFLANASSTPDRTTYLLQDSDVPVETMVHYAQILEQAGAEVLFVVCNTAHGYHKQVQSNLSIPWVHLMDITAQHIKKSYPGIKKVGILATDATVQLKLYHKALEDHTITPVAPRVHSAIQNGVMDAIYHKDFGIKATGAHVDPTAIKNLILGAQWCLEQGAEAIIAGCTEISVGLNEKIFPFAPIIDPLAVASDTALDIAFGLKNPDEFMINYDR